MVSEAIRDPAKDDLLTPQNSTFIIIDYQPVQVNSIASMDRQILVNNITGRSTNIRPTIAPRSIRGKTSNSARRSRRPAARSSS
jgi:hypothetical protein